MLKDAALLQLDLLLAALEHDLVLKDSTPYNVQFQGARPVFVDVGSFERMREGEPWVGYRQFCMLYLYPLLLQSREGRALPALAARLDRRHHAGADARPDVVPRPLSQGHVHQRLPARAAREALRATGPARSSRRSSASSRRSCSWPTCARCASWSSGSSGTRPRASGPPTASATATPTTTPGARTSSCARWPTSRAGTLVWDIGANNGRYSRIAAEGARDGRGRRRRPGPGGAALPRPAQARATSRS